MLYISNYVLDLVNKIFKYYEKSNNYSRSGGFGDGNLNHLIAQFRSTKTSGGIPDDSHSDCDIGICTSGCS